VMQAANNGGGAMLAQRFLGATEVASEPRLPPPRLMPPAVTMTASSTSASTSAASSVSVSMFNTPADTPALLLDGTYTTPRAAPASTFPPCLPFLGVPGRAVQVHPRSTLLAFNA